MHDTDHSIGAVASQQHGAFSLSQLREAGGNPSLASRRCREGRWQRCGSGVLRIVGAPETFEQRVMIAFLAAGPGSAVSHRTALRLWGIAGRQSVPIELSVAAGRGRSRRGVVFHRSRDLHLADIQWRSGIAVTGLTRTLLDLGGVAPDLVRPSVWAAMRTHGIGWDDLLRVLVAHSGKGRVGLAPLRQIVSAHYGDASGDSATEDLALQILVDSGRVPKPERLVPVICADGVTVTADLGWAEHRAYVEVYGVDHLTNEDLQHLDHHRANQLRLAGNELVTYTGRLLRRQPDQFVRDVEAMLRRCGWGP